MTAELQCQLFEIALNEVGDAGQFVNEVIEVDLTSMDDDVSIRRYTLPDEGG